MLIEIIQLRLIKVWVSLAVCLFFKNNYSKKCLGCGSELDIEDCFFNNSCEFCGASQGYDRDYYDNSDLLFYRDERGCLLNG